MAKTNGTRSVVLGPKSGESCACWSRRASAAPSGVTRGGYVLSSVFSPR